MAANFDLSDPQSRMSVFRRMGIIENYEQYIPKPLNLVKNDEYNSLLNIKQSFDNTMKESIYYVVDNQTEKSNFNATIQRYSDKYSKKKSLIDEFEPDWCLFPKELKTLCEKKRKVKSKKVELKRKRMRTTAGLLDDLNAITEGAENEEQDEESGDDNDKKSEKDKNESENENLEGEEEEEEEENDYIDTYFDNGENDDDGDFGGDDDGPVY